MTGKETEAIMMHVMHALYVQRKAINLINSVCEFCTELNITVGCLLTFSMKCDATASISEVIGYVISTCSTPDPQMNKM